MKSTVMVQEKHPAFHRSIKLQSDHTCLIDTYRVYVLHVLYTKNGHRTHVCHLIQTSNSSVSE